MIGAPPLEALPPASRSPKKCIQSCCRPSELSECPPPEPGPDIPGYAYHGVQEGQEDPDGHPPPPCGPELCLLPLSISLPSVTHPGPWEASQVEGKGYPQGPQRKVGSCPQGP